MLFDQIACSNEGETLWKRKHRRTTAQHTLFMYSIFLRCQILKAGILRWRRQEIKRYVILSDITATPAVNRREVRRSAEEEAKMPLL